MRPLPEAATTSRSGGTIQAGGEAADPAAFIRAHLPLVAVPTIPEIRLHRAQPTSNIGRLAAGAPYWAYPWPGGIAIARHILDHPEIVAGRRVIDLGAGSGLVAIAAAQAGARDIIAAEIDRHAAAALRLNAAANGVTLTISTDDLTRGPPPPVDVILVGDLFYERITATRVKAFLARCHAAGIASLVGDIGRPFLPRASLSEIADYVVPEVGAAAAEQRGTVFRFAPSAQAARSITQPRSRRGPDKTRGGP